MNLERGEHVVVLTRSCDPTVAAEGRRSGLVLRDTFLVLLPGRTEVAFLFWRSCSATARTGAGLGNLARTLNIDGARVTTGDNRARFNHARRREAGTSYVVQQKDGLIDPGGHGRWPPNLLLVHGPQCRKDESRRRTCQPNCPVRLLDEQSGMSRSVSAIRGKRHGRIYGSGRGPSGPSGWRGHDDAGGSSRFYPQFRDEDDLRDWLRLLITPPSGLRRAAWGPVDQTRSALGQR